MDGQNYNLINKISDVFLFTYLILNEFDDKLKVTSYNKRLKEILDCCCSYFQDG